MLTYDFEKFESLNVSSNFAICGLPIHFLPNTNIIQMLGGMNYFEESSQAIIL